MKKNVEKENEEKENEEIENDDTNEEKKSMIQEHYEDLNKTNEEIIIFFQKTLQNTISAFFLSLISTIVNFTCNIPLLRKVSKESYGVVKVYFELAFTLVNFIPRETMRRTSQKFCPDKDSEKEKDKFITLSQINYIFIFFSSIISIIIFFSFMFFTDNDLLHQNYIQLIIYIVCGLIEMIIEPVILHMNLHMENKFLPITISSLSRVISNTIFIAFFDMDLWAFTLSRIIGSSVYILFIFFLGVFKYKLNFFIFIPRNIKSIFFDKFSNNGTNLIYLREVFYQFIKLNLLNLILSKCQNLILSFILKSNEEEKSDYSFIFQNFSLISRFLLEPIIDAFYNLVNKIKYIEKKKEEFSKIEKDINKIEDIDNKIQEFETKNEDSPKVEELVEKKVENKEKKENNEKTDTQKKINYDLTIKLLQFFIKIFVYIGILIIPYYILIGTEVMGLIYGEKWQNNTIDKIGDCYSYYVIIVAISDLIKNFGNATNDTHQMNLSYISLISNAIFLSLFSYILSKWDICGLIITNVLSSIFLINFNFYIIFCGKKQKLKLNDIEEPSIIGDIKYFIKKCFITMNSLGVTFVSILIGGILKKVIISHVSTLFIIFVVIIIGLINIIFIYRFEKKNFINDFNIIKSYQKE